ncbi:glycoside hydrolase family 3 protein [Daedalea quercina L-15889]|uniref:Probable beta-glucosidase G n=1 Tax=Daedalea quercina L-15889 TaxID=1314783 RepID=A0A165PLL2_9APHY|nr:glycoside hydrolase family 3 protein [Daedalea quercina L-15889]
MHSTTLCLLTAALALFVTPSSGNASRRDDATSGALSDNSPETWPAPNATGGNAWTDAFSRAQTLVAEMTLEEKITLITGQSGPCSGSTGAVERLGIPVICLEDGTSGVRPIQGSSQFPAGQAVAATWDKDLIYQRGYAMGQEFFDQGVNIALSPVTGGPLGRSPRDGRNFEGFFSDAYGTGEAAYLTVKGMQDAGILTTAKHYIGYEQETFRNPFNLTESYSIFPANEQAPISSNIDNKALHEVYLWGFAEAVRAGTGYVMCSYNLANDTHSCANAYTLNNILKGELNFQGGIVSDWGAVWGDAEFINGGLDICMPGVGYGGILGTMWGDALIPYVENGTVAESRVDDAAVRLLTPWINSGQADSPPPAVTWNSDPTFFETDDAYWHDVRKIETMGLIRQIGEDSATLLKNVDGALPLGQPKVITIIGSDAGVNDIGVLDSDGIAQYPLWNDNGTLTLGGGSGWAIPPYLVTPYEAINYRGRKLNSQVYTVFNDTAYDAVGTAAQSADVAIVFVSAFTREGEDRATLYLDHEGETLITTVAANSNNTVVVIHAGGPVLVEEWIDNPNVTAAIAAHFPGQESGDAIAGVLFGDVSPSGKLPYTIGHSLDEYPPHTIVDDHVVHPQADFNESTLVDYRWFSAHNITPRFEFGYGLSYSTFSYSNVSVRDVYEADNTSIQQTNERFEGSDGSNSLYDVIAEVTAQVTNTGNVVACEVAQLYATFPDSPGIWLRGFDKLKALVPGETRTATFPLRRKDLSLWSTEKQLWYIPEGEIQLQVGASSAKLYLTTTWPQ